MVSVRFMIRVRVRVQGRVRVGLATEFIGKSGLRSNQQVSRVHFKRVFDLARSVLLLPGDEKSKVA